MSRNEPTKAAAEMRAEEQATSAASNSIEAYKASLNARIEQARLAQERIPVEPFSYTPSRNREDVYRPVLGNLTLGTALYDKTTKSPFGFVVDVDWGSVWVADRYSSGGGNVRLYARRYDRNFITQNYVTK